MNLLMRRRSLMGGLTKKYAATTLHPRWTESGSPLIYGTDKFNFGALPTGYRTNNGEFSYLGDLVYWWTAIEFVDNPIYVRIRHLNYDVSGVGMYYFTKPYGIAVRCVRAATIQEQALADGTIIQNAATDYDGNVYTGTKLGTQVWLRESLQTTHYNDGTLIPTNLSNASWAADTSGAMAVYNKADGEFVPINNLTTVESMKDAYGCLYNWYAVNNIKGLAPDGFSIPIDTECTTLTNYLISQGTTQGVTVGYNSPNDKIITSLNVGDALKSYRQINSPFYYYE